jgi:hypothetical protein
MDAVQGGRQVLAQLPGGIGVTAPLGKAHDLQNAHAAVERDSDDVAGTHRLAGGSDTGAVEPDKTADDKLGRIRPRTHHAGVP